jgi:hypothetical protein
MNGRGTRLVIAVGPFSGAYRLSVCWEGAWALIGSFRGEYFFSTHRGNAGEAFEGGAVKDFVVVVEEALGVVTLSIPISKFSDNRPHPFVSAKLIRYICIDNAKGSPIK